MVIEAIMAAAMDLMDIMDIMDITEATKIPILQAHMSRDISINSTECRNLCMRR